MPHIVRGLSVSTSDHIKLRDLKERETEKIQEGSKHENCEMMTTGHEIVAAFKKSQQLR